MAGEIRNAAVNMQICTVCPPIKEEPHKALRFTIPVNRIFWSVHPNNGVEHSLSEA